MTNFYNSASYKNKVINLLIRNENFVKLVNPTPNKCEELDIVDVLIGGKWIINGKEYREQGHIFDYNFVNDTIREEKTFVFVDTDIDSVKDNMFTDFNLIKILSESQIRLFLQQKKLRKWDVLRVLMPIVSMRYVMLSIRS